MNKIPDENKRVLLVGGPLHGVVIEVPEDFSTFTFCASPAFSFTYLKRSIWISRVLSRIRYEVFMSFDPVVPVVTSEEFRSLIDEAGISPLEIQSEAVS